MTVPPTRRASADVLQARADRGRIGVDQGGGTADNEPVAEARRRGACEAADRYLAELIEEVGEPSSEEVAEAEEWCDRIERHLKKARAAG